MAQVDLVAGGSGNSGALSGQTIFYIETGTVDISTDAGTTYIPFYQGDRFVVSDSLTVHWLNRYSQAASFSYMSF